MRWEKMGLRAVMREEYNMSTMYINLIPSLLKQYDVSHTCANLVLHYNAQIKPNFGVWAIFMMTLCNFED